MQGRSLRKEEWFTNILDLCLLLLYELDKENRTKNSKALIERSTGKFDVWSNRTSLHFWHLGRNKLWHNCQKYPANTVGVILVASNISFEILALLPVFDFWMWHVTKHKRFFCFWYYAHLSYLISSGRTERRRFKVCALVWSEQTCEMRKSLHDPTFSLGKISTKKCVTSKKQH